MSYKIMCQVSGGVTGTRQALYKRNDEVVTFDTEEEAQAETRRLNEKMNNKYAKATFKYWVVS